MSNQYMSHTPGNTLKGHRRTRRIGFLVIEILADYSHLIV